MVLILSLLTWQLVFIFVSKPKENTYIRFTISYDYSEKRLKIIKISVSKLVIVKTIEFHLIHANKVQVSLSWYKCYI